MPALNLQLAAALVAVALLGWLVVVVARDPFAIVRAEYARARWSLGLRWHGVVIDGQRWAYVERAADHAGAPTVVMLHGYTGSKENWYRLAAYLRGRCRLVIPDLPGWGQSERVADGVHGYDAQAARVAAFLAAVSDQPVVLLGHSMGGGIAAVTAAQHPELVAEVGLLDASGVEFEENAFGREVVAGRNPFGVHDAASLERYLGVLFQSRAARPLIPWPASRIVIARRRHDSDFEQSVLDCIGRGETRFLPGELAGKIRQPALLLWGRQDAVIDPSALDLYAARIPHARKVLLDDCGHMSLMEHPGKVADAVIALMEGRGQR